MNIANVMCEMRDVEEDDDDAFDDGFWSKTLELEAKDKIADDVWRMVEKLRSKHADDWSRARKTREVMVHKAAMLLGAIEHLDRMAADAKEAA